MPVTDAGGVNFDIEADPYDLGAERGFREGRAADIAKTDEQHDDSEAQTGYVLLKAQVAVTGDEQIKVRLRQCQPEFLK